MQRGEVWWAEMPAPLGRRPVVLLSRDAAYRIRQSVTVGQITTRVRGIGAEVALGPEDGLPRQCVANLDNISTVPKASLLERISLLSPRKIADIDVAIRYALGMEG